METFLCQDTRQISSCSVHLYHVRDFYVCGIRDDLKDAKRKRGAQFLLFISLLPHFQCNVSFDSNNDLDVDYTQSFEAFGSALF